MFKHLRLGAARARAIEEKLYAEALAELNRGELRNGLWAKAISQSEGDKDKAQAIYLRLRVQCMKDETVIMEAIMEASTLQTTERVHKVAGSKVNERLCERCGTAVTINYGDAYRILCEHCS
ncbi:hypothetical protein [Marinobacter nauticus]|uniref:hypothetical protein n=1 Tax=Marinobacter nauticus TaxID=2743 RepID=UPI000EB37C9F|nr:hypothetical protein [Marinobacter nauticus]RKR70980.1 hypothetical protein C7436_3465 [Marinobacter nauticus]